MRHGRTTRYDDHIALRLSAELRGRLRRLAASEELRVSEICREAIRDRVDEYERGRKRILERCGECQPGGRSRAGCLTGARPRARFAAPGGLDTLPARFMVRARIP